MLEEIVFKMMDKDCPMWNGGWYYAEDEIVIYYQPFHDGIIQLTLKKEDRKPVKCLCVLRVGMIDGIDRCCIDYNYRFAKEYDSLNSVLPFIRKVVDVFKKNCYEISYKHIFKCPLFDKYFLDSEHLIDTETWSEELENLGFY